MTYQEFVTKYRNRLESYIIRFSKRFGLYGAAVDDLRQEAHFAVFRALPYWRDCLRLNSEESSKLRFPTGHGGTSGNIVNASQSTDNGDRRGIGSNCGGLSPRSGHLSFPDTESVSEYRRGKSAFNWCAGPMRRAMEKSVRREFGQRPFAVEPICDRREPFHESTFVGPGKSDLGIFGASIASVESKLDLARALKNDKKPSDISRFVICTLSSASGAELARHHGISRQAICMGNRKTRERLRAALG